MIGHTADLAGRNLILGEIVLIVRVGLIVTVVQRHASDCSIATDFDACN
jgi:hypothetical protein